MKKSCIIAILLISHNVYASAIQQYLTIVYPTSSTIAAMSEKQAHNFYRHNLHLWYRVPIVNHRNGLLAKRPFIFYGTYMQSDAVAIDGSAGDTIGRQGFISTVPSHGSNKNHIEVASYGASIYSSGAYFYWAPGSGVYINTHGSTIVGYNKVDVIYKLLGKRRNNFIKQLTNIPMVQRQIWGVAKPLSKTLLNGICQGKPIYFYANNYPGGVHGLTLLGGLRSTGHWHHLRAELCSQQHSINYVNNKLMSIYLTDHDQGNYDLKKTRYAYIIGEANIEIDDWLYRVAKEKHVDVLQITRAPNNYLKTAFEICDARWPAMSASKTTLSNLVTQWKWAVKQHWYQVRDPFNLDNDNSARDIKINYNNAKAIEDFPSWFASKACPVLLKLLNKQQCYTVQFAIDNSGGGGFSMTDVSHNLALLSKHSKTMPSSHSRTVGHVE